MRLTEPAREFLAEEGYDPVYGARPLKRAIQQYLQDPLALDLLEGKFQRGRCDRGGLWTVNERGSCLRKR